MSHSQYDNHHHHQDCRQSLTPSPENIPHETSVKVDKHLIRPTHVSNEALATIVRSTGHLLHSLVKDHHHHHKHEKEPQEEEKQDEKREEVQDEVPEEAQSE